MIFGFEGPKLKELEQMWRGIVNVPERVLNYLIACDEDILIFFTL
jgi:hypothetical protein